jgi:antitoxin (DNA-binding transcriptional repressor) of toxin-antitoxin stability system
MRKARIAELKNNLSRYLDHVRGGETVLVLDRDQPVAQIVPLRRAASGSRSDHEAQLARLERRGVIRRGRGGVPAWLGKRRPPRATGVLAALLEERRGGR